MRAHAAALAAGSRSIPWTAARRHDAVKVDLSATGSQHPHRFLFPSAAGRRYACAGGCVLAALRLSGYDRSVPRAMGAPQDLRPVRRRVAVPQSLVDVHRELLARYIEWLNARRRANGQALEPSRVARVRTRSLRKLLQWLERCRPGLLGTHGVSLQPLSLAQPRHAERRRSSPRGSCGRS